MNSSFNTTETHVEAPKSRAGLPVLLAAILGCSMVTASVATVVNTRAEELRAGYALHALQRQRAKLSATRDALRLEVAALVRADRLAKIAPELGLFPPKREQVLR